MEVGFADERAGEGVVEVMGVVGDGVGEVDDLGFEGAWARGEGVIGAGLIVAGFVAGDAEAGFPGEVEASEVGVGVFEELDDAKGVAIVVEAAVVAHELVEGDFAGVAEGGVAEVVGEGDGFGEVFVEAEGAGEGTGDLGDFDGVGETGAVVVGIFVEEDLGFGFEAAEGGAVDDAVAVALEAGAERVFGFGVLAALGGGGGDGIGGEAGGFELLEGGAVVNEGVGGIRRRGHGAAPIFRRLRVGGGREG